jgi:GAF domain-containing protein
MTEPRHNFDLAQALADAAQAINAPGSLEDTLNSITTAARDAVPGFDHVGISVVQGDGAVVTMGATSDLVRHLDTLQYELGEGPCVATLRDQTVVLVEDLADDRRWPRYVPRATEAGVRAQLGVQLSTNDQTLGGLNFYSTSTSSIDPDAPRLAQLFATHAALALDHARHADQANEAMPTRQLIGQAVGILMERFEITEDRAMYLLVRVATAGRLKLRDVAREVVDQVTIRAHRHLDDD